MAFQFADRLHAAGEQRMWDLFNTLSEKDQRRFAAFEARQRAHAGDPDDEEIIFTDLSPAQAF